MANYGFKVSRTGYDVKTASILNQSFNSEKNCIKVAASGTASHSVVAHDNYTFSISHSFDFVPAFLVYLEWDDDGKWAMAQTNWFLWAYMALSSEAWSDVDNLYVKVYNEEDDSRVCKIFYVIFADEAS